MISKWFQTYLNKNIGKIHNFESYHCIHGSFHLNIKKKSKLKKKIERLESELEEGADRE